MREGKGSRQQLTYLVGPISLRLCARWLATPCMSACVHGHVKCCLAPRPCTLVALVFIQRAWLCAQVAWVHSQEEIDVLQSAHQQQGVGRLLSRGGGAPTKQLAKLARKADRLARDLFTKHHLTVPARGGSAYAFALSLLREREVVRLCDEIEDISLGARAIRADRLIAASVQVQQRMDKKVRTMHTKIRTTLGPQLEAWQRAPGIAPPGPDSRVLVVPAAFTQEDYTNIFNGMYPWGEPSAPARAADKFFDARCEVSGLSGGA